MCWDFNMSVFFCNDHCIYSTTSIDLNPLQDVLLRYWLMSMLLEITFILRIDILDTKQMWITTNLWVKLNIR